MKSVILGFLGIASPSFIVIGLITFEITGNNGYLIVITAGALLYLWRFLAKGLALRLPKYLAAKSKLIVGCSVATVGAITLSLGILESSSASIGSPPSPILLVGLAILVLGVLVYTLSFAFASPSMKPR